MQSYLDVIAELYRVLVGPSGSRDLPQNPPAEGFYFCPMPTVNKLWASITFVSTRNCGLVATVKVYAPGEGYCGRDAVYLTISGRRGSNTSPECFIEYDLVDDERIRRPAKIAECKLILVLCKKIVDESGVLEHPLEIGA